MTEVKMTTGPSRAEIQPFTMSTSAVAEHLPSSSPKPAPGGRSGMSKRLKLLILNVVSIVGGIAIWWLLALSGFQLPTPPEVVAKAVQLWNAGILQEDILASLGRVLTGFLLGSAAAIPVGFLMGWYTVGARPARAVDPVLPHHPAAGADPAGARADGHRRGPQGRRHLPRRVPRLRDLDLPGRRERRPDADQRGTGARREGRYDLRPRRRARLHPVHPRRACASASARPGRRWSPPN